MFLHQIVTYSLFHYLENDFRIFKRAIQIFNGCFKIPYRTYIWCQTPKSIVAATENFTMSPIIGLWLWHPHGTYNDFGLSSSRRLCTPRWQTFIFAPLSYPWPLQFWKQKSSWSYVEVCLMVAVRVSIHEETNLASIEYSCQNRDASNRTPVIRSDAVPFSTLFIISILPYDNNIAWFIVIVFS